MRAVVAILCAALLGGAASAQQTAPEAGSFTPPVVQAPALLTVDFDRLFASSLFGDRIAREYNEGRVSLAAENRRIAEALREEELSLAQRRPEMEVEAFRREAAAFDAKAQGIRRTQDAKEQEMEETLNIGREQFLDVTRPILGQIMIERQAFAILERRSVLLSLGSIDITDEAVALIDATIGDGTPRPDAE